MTYAEKLKNPLWQRKRLEILQRDGFSCCYCGDAKTELHIHHEYYDFKLDPWEYDEPSLKSVCKYCHLILENIKQDASILQTHKILRLASDVYYIYFLIKATTDSGINALLYAYDRATECMNHVINLKEETCLNILNFLQSK